MKKMLMPVIAVLFLASCEKNVAVPGTANAPKFADHSNQRKWVDWNYTLRQDPTSGEYSCPTPKSDCAKIQPDPTSSLSTLDHAISTNAVSAFFNSDSWSSDFPYLGNQADVVSGLQNGNYTMVRRTNSAGEILYIVISSDENPDAFTSAIYTTLVTKD
jgi:hypothetical protein